MGHKLTVTLPPRPVIVDADMTRLAQVILNLLNNAAKYTERGGRIDLRAELQGSDVVVSVTDTGIGIPADKLPTLFEMFSQVEGALSRSQGGLGIGLCLVKRLVEMHGGSIEANSGGPGRGSEFVVRLPIVVEWTCPRPASHDGDMTKAISNLRILVVDDNRDAAESLAMLLMAMGNNVHTAHDGEEAVAAAGKYRPDVVLCDIGLPKLSGYEACRQMKEQAWDKKMILVAVTGWGQDEDRRRSSEAGFDYHLVKPVDLRNLSNLLLGDPRLFHTPTGKNCPLRVLIVDDMRDARHMLSTLLKASGHDVQTASDGLTAISVALDFQPNVVLMDIRMPGMSGLEVATQMRLEPKLKDAMLIALTGNADEDDRQQSLEAGFNHHLVKPPDISMIRELLRNVR
jgi:CheY-like chemotaxis protein